MESKSDKRHRENIARQQQRRRNAEARDAARGDRDEKIRAVNEKYLPKIEDLIKEHRAELKKIWDDWKNIGRDS